MRMSSADMPLLSMFVFQACGDFPFSNIAPNASDNCDETNEEAAAQGQKAHEFAVVHVHKDVRHFGSPVSQPLSFAGRFQTDSLCPVPALAAKSLGRPLPGAV